ncbi:MAG: NAD(P)H-binding protein [Spirulina sp. SIO3F2]|nr:NAD(P)H-binding protein [Spirulina sp. SIO3F2]
MKSQPILVTGATGKTGSRISKLLEHAGHTVRRASRHAEKPFDWQNATTWESALAGVQAVYICFYPDFAFPGALDTLSAFAETAKSAGVGRLVMITGRGEHYAQLGEEVILNSGVPATILRSAWFAQNFSEGSLYAPVMEGVIPMPGGDIGEPIVDLDDFAEVAAKVLTATGYEGQIYEITGPQVITFAEVAKILTETLGRPIEYLPITFEAFHEALEHATDRQYADIVTSIAKETFDGRNARRANGIERVLNRSPRDFTEFASKAAQTGCWTIAA